MSLQRANLADPEAPLDREGTVYSDGGSSFTSASTEEDSRAASPYSMPKRRSPSPRLPVYKASTGHHQSSGTLSDIRLRVLLCRKAWSLLIRSKMTVPLSSVTKFPLVAVLILVGVLLGLAVLRPFASPPAVMVPVQIYGPTTGLHSEQLRPYQDTNQLYVDSRVMAGDIHPMIFRGKRHKNNGRWASLGHNFPKEGYIYTAFYDDRKSLGKLPAIRVIGVLEEFDSPTIYCALYYQTKGIMEHVEVVKTDIGAGVSRHDKNFKEYILTCQMIHEDVPDSVGIVSDQNYQPGAMIPVEIAERPATRYNFGVCISITYWRQDPYHIVEWLELLRILGVSKVSIYNNSMEYESARVFEEYNREGFIDFRQSHNFMSDPGELTIHMHMSPVINDCMYRGMYKFKKIIVTDFDEIIIPRTVETYTDMLSAIDRQQAEGNNHPAKHYIFRNNYFFLDIPGEDITQSPRIMTLRHRKRIPVSEPGYAIKSIIDPLACTNMHNHYCWKSTPLYDNAYGTVEVEPGLALNQHYKTCHLDVWERPGMCQELMKVATQDDIMLRYKSRLESAMSVKLAKLGLSKLVH